MARIYIDGVRQVSVDQVEIDTRIELEDGESGGSHSFQVDILDGGNTLGTADLSKFVTGSNSYTDTITIDTVDAETTVDVFVSLYSPTSDSASASLTLDIVETSTARIYIDRVRQVSVDQVEIDTRIELDGGGSGGSYDFQVDILDSGNTLGTADFSKSSTGSYTDTITIDTVDTVTTVDVFVSLYSPNSDYDSASHTLDIVDEPVIDVTATGCSTPNHSLDIGETGEVVAEFRNDSNTAVQFDLTYTVNGRQIGNNTAVSTWYTNPSEVILDEGQSGSSTIEVEGEQGGDHSIGVEIQNVRAY